MSTLFACASCRRLVRIADTRCPFCAAAQTQPRSRTTLGRASRGAILVSAAVALGGPIEACKRMWGMEPAVEDAGSPVAITVYGGPPPTLTPPAPPPLDAGATPDAKRDR